MKEILIARTKQYWMYISRLSLIVRVNVVLNRTVVVDSDWRFDNLCGSHLQSQKNWSPIQDYVHPDDQIQPTYEMTPGFKPFTIQCTLTKSNLSYRGRLNIQFASGVSAFKPLRTDQDLRKFGVRISSCNGMWHAPIMAKLRSVTEIALTSPLSCVNRSHIRYGFSCRRKNYLV